MAEGFPQVQEQTPHQRRRKLSKDPRPVMAAYPTITDLSRVRGEGSSFQTFPGGRFSPKSPQGARPAWPNHRWPGPVGSSPEGQQAWEHERDHLHRVRFKQIRLGKTTQVWGDERKGNSGLEIRSTGLHCLLPAGYAEVLTRGKLRTAGDPSMAPYKGQGLYDHVPPKLEPGNTLTDGRDPAPTLHTRSSNLL